MLTDEEAAVLIQLAVFYRARAKHVRELATAVNHPEATHTLRRYAEDIEERANDLEARAARLKQTRPQEP